LGSYVSRPASHGDCKTEPPDIREERPVEALARPCWLDPGRSAQGFEDLAEAKAKWVMEVKSPEAQKERMDSSFLAYRDSAGRVADFHALRHTYVSRLVRSGANAKVAQNLARHSTPTLTLVTLRPRRHSRPD